MINTAQGRDIEEYRSRNDSDDRVGEHRRFLLPYLVLIATQLPLALVYLKGLWFERPHYMLMPVAFAGTAFFLYLRWPRAEEPAYFSSTKSDILLGLGIASGILATVWLSPWFGFASFLLFFASLLARTNDRHVFGTLLPALAPMALLLQPPAAIDFDTVQGDIELMSWINSTGTKVASDILDLALYPHNITDNQMEFPFGPLDSIWFGNNTLSVFTLLLITGLFIAWQQIPMFRAAMLILAACFWAMAFEAFELIFCAIAQSSFEKNWFAPGSANQSLQAFGLLGAGIMTLLSERLILFLFGPVDLQAIDENISWQDHICRFWNKAIAGVTSPVIDFNVKKEVAWAKRRNSLPSTRVANVLRGCVLAMGILAVIQVAGIASAWFQSDNATMPDNQSVALQRDALPATLVNCSCTGFVEEAAERKSVYLADQYDWTYQDAQGQEYHVNIRLPHSGWYDLSRDLRAEDFDVQVGPEYSEVQIADQPLEQSKGVWRNNLAEFRTSYSAQFDGFGESFQIPAMWNDPVRFADRGLARIGNRTRPRLLNGRSVLIHVYVDTIGPNPATTTARCEQLFLAVVEHYLTSHHANDPADLNSAE